MMENGISKLEYPNWKCLPKFGEQKGISSEQELRDYGSLVGKLVLEWDTKKIVDLIDLIKELNEVISTLDNVYSVHTDLDAYGVDMSDLPSAYYPDWLGTVNFWAVDQDGMCLVGEEASEKLRFSDFVEGVRFSEQNEDLKTSILAESMFSVLDDIIIYTVGTGIPDLHDIMHECSLKILTILYKTAKITAKFHQNGWTYQHPTNGSWEQNPEEIMHGWSEQDPKEQKEWEKLVEFLKDPEIWDFMDQGDNGDTIFCPNAAAGRNFTFLSKSKSNCR